MDAVYSHTVYVMNTMKNKGVTPDWVQVGNETNNGMLWEDGKASANMKNYAWLVNTGHNAVKSVSARPRRSFIYRMATTMNCSSGTLVA